MSNSWWNGGHQSSFPEFWGDNLSPPVQNIASQQHPPLLLTTEATTITVTLDYHWQMGLGFQAIVSLGGNEGAQLTTETLDHESNYWFLTYKRTNARGIIVSKFIKPS